MSPQPGNPSTPTFHSMVFLSLAILLPMKARDNAVPEPSELNEALDNIVREGNCPDNMEQVRKSL